MELVALYLRVSTDEQKKHGLSLEAQLKNLQDYCKFKGWSIYKVYRDEGISGKSTKNRTAFIEMLEDSRNKKFSIILVTKIDRAFRNVMDALTSLEELRKNKIDFVSIAEDIDTTTPMGKAMFTIISVFAQLERELNVKRVSDVRKFRFDKGMFPARAPFGYSAIRKNKKVVGFKVNKRESEIVKKVFKDSFESIDYKITCKELNIKPGSYYNILKNKAYIGIIEFNGVEKKGLHEPLVSEEVFKEVNSNL